MTTKKHAIAAYLDKEEVAFLCAIALEWGCSMSAAIKRLIREKAKEG